VVNGTDLVRLTQTFQTIKGQEGRRLPYWARSLVKGLCEQIPRFDHPGPIGAGHNGARGLGDRRPTVLSVSHSPTISEQSQAIGHNDQDKEDQTDNPDGFHFALSHQANGPVS